MQGNDEAKRLEYVSILISITLSIQTLDELIEKNKSNQFLVEKRNIFLKELQNIENLYKINNLDECIKNLKNLSLVISREMPFIKLNATILSIKEADDHIKTIEDPKAQELLKKIEEVVSSIKKLDHHIFDDNVGRVRIILKILKNKCDNSYDLSKNGFVIGSLKNIVFTDDRTSDNDYTYNGDDKETFNTYCNLCGKLLYDLFKIFKKKEFYDQLEKFKLKLEELMSLGKSKFDDSSYSTQPYSLFIRTLENVGNIVNKLISTIKDSDIQGILKKEEDILIDIKKIKLEMGNVQKMLLVLDKLDQSNLVKLFMEELKLFDNPFFDEVSNLKKDNNLNEAMDLLETKILQPIVFTSFNILSTSLSRFYNLLDQLRLEIKELINFNYKTSRILYSQEEYKMECIMLINLGDRFNDIVSDINGVIAGKKDEDINKLKDDIKKLEDIQTQRQIIYQANHNQGNKEDPQEENKEENKQNKNQKQNQNNGNQKKQSQNKNQNQKQKKNDDSGDYGDDKNKRDGKQYDEQKAKALASALEGKKPLSISILDEVLAEKVNKTYKIEERDKSETELSNPKDFAKALNEIFAENSHEFQRKQEEQKQGVQKLPVPAMKGEMGIGLDFGDIVKLFCDYFGFSCNDGVSNHYTQAEQQQEELQLYIHNTYHTNDVSVF